MFNLYLLLDVIETNTFTLLRIDQYDHLSQKYTDNPTQEGPVNVIRADPVAHLFL